MEHPYIIGWGTTSRVLRETLHINAFYILESGDYYNVLTEEQGDYYVAQAGVGTLREQVDTDWFLSCLRKCTLDRDEEFLVLQCLDTHPKTLTEQGFFWQDEEQKRLTFATTM